MFVTHSFCFLVLSLTLFKCVSSDQITDETVATEYASELDESYSMECNMEMEASWAYMTDVENETLEAEANEADVLYFMFQSEAAMNVSMYAYDGFDDVELYRQFRFQADQGPGGLDNESLALYQDLQSTMETIYSTATICPYGEPVDCSAPMALEPDIENIMATSTNFSELTYVWEQWREVTGKLMRENFTDFVELSNEAAMADGYEDTGDYWLNGYTVTEKEAGYYGDGELDVIDQEKFKMIVADIFDDVLQNLYKPLHAYVRMRLKTLYPDQIVLNSTLPANILGNMWAQDWTNIAKYVMPFDDVPDFDVTQSMIDNNWDIDRMFEEAEDFFVSIGLYEMTDTFWEMSVINQTKWDKVMICHASAEDFCLGKDSTDFRIKMCTQVNMADLVTVHHEMGHIEYFMAYRDQPHVFRDSANPGFHEAIGDLIALSVSTPSHMENVLNLTFTADGEFYYGEQYYTPIGEFDDAEGTHNYTDTEKEDLNFLMRMALEKIAFLPFGYLIDDYRWAVFDGSVSNETLNTGWWRRREHLQGVSPPSGRRGEEYFDPGAKYHVPANVPYIRYFVSFIVQFQFHRRLCMEAGFEGPLYACDIYNSTDAGDVLKDAMMKGLSLPWPLVLEELGGSLAMDASAIKEYFQPLMDYLRDELDGQLIGWYPINDTEVNDIAQEGLNLMEEDLTPLLVESVEAAWEYETNMTDFNAEVLNNASIVFSQGYYNYWNSFLSVFNYEAVSDQYIRRQFEMQQSIGTSILPADQLEELNMHLTNMAEAYSSKVCPFEDMKCDEKSEGYDIDRLEIEMATNREYSALLYYWEKWRDVSGKEMIDDYKPYVDLMNEAAMNNSFTDAGVMWIEPYTIFDKDEFHGIVYEADDFKADIHSLLNQTFPYYQLLQAYVRDKLQARDDYEKYFEDDRLIPAHILGDMWAQSWENIYDLVVPYPEVDLIDISEALQTTDVEEMFLMAEDFFVSLGMYEMTEDFWNNSMMVQPEDGRTVVCHPSAWDFYSTTDNNTQDGIYRIKMCANQNQEDFITIHHEMGHIEYFMSYSEDKPIIYRDGANPGFHEAIGDTIALSVATPSHLIEIQEYLVPNGTLIETEADEFNSTEQNINFLMKQALSKFAFLPYAYILDQWRWEVFAGKTLPDVYNKRWWEMRIDYQGIRPGIDRSAKLDFDIGSKYHVSASVPYIRYFVATILQFQFHGRLCEVAGNTEEVFNCDIYGSELAGNALLDMLSNGASVQWQDQLKTFLNTTDAGEMSAEAIIEYFRPLWDYLEMYINNNNVEVGWKGSDEVIDDYINETETISAVVPIVVGSVLAVLVCIVLVAFFFGQRRRKQQNKKKEATKAVGGAVNEAMELGETENKVEEGIESIKEEIEGKTYSSIDDD